MLLKKKVKFYVYFIIKYVYFITIWKNETWWLGEKKERVPTTPANQKQIHFSELKNTYSEG